MAYRSLREFVDRLAEEGDLARVSEPVSTVLEMTEISSRLLARDGPAVLFEKPIRADGEISPIPCLANLFGSVRRVAMGVQFDGEKRREARDLRAVGEVLALLRNPEPPRNMGEALRLLPIARKILTMSPRTVRRASVHDEILTGAQIDLSKLPIQTCWPKDAGPLITWPLVATRGPSSAREDDFNLGIYRMQVIDKDRTIMRWLAHRGGAQHFRRWKEAAPRGPLPACAIIGADPATILAAVAPLPDTVSEYAFAGLLRGARLDLVKARTQPILVPARAEMVIEGEVLLDETAEEGPFGDHTGYYNAVERFPVFRATAITMREKPIYLTTYTGRPPDEPSVLGEALNEIFIPLLTAQFPEIVDFWLPPEGCSYRFAVVSIRKAYLGHARRVMMGVWSYLRQFAYTKWVIVVDDDIDIRDWKDVIWAIATRLDPARDAMIIENSAIDYLDFASPESGLGSKIGLDATSKWPGETRREWGEPIAMDAAVVERVDAMWSALGLPGPASTILRAKGAAPG
ncbi:MAG: UbiD family decarboxylase [Caulobacteraceae bacterium]